MIRPKENRRCYASETQREVLLQLITEPSIEEHFFLTGGTALAVFYLHHRISNDLDLFSLKQTNLSELGFWMKGLWPEDMAVIQQSPHFLSCLVRETRIDLVIDPHSADEERPSRLFENGHELQIDTIESIVSNKFCTCVSRTEPKDYVDLYFIFKKIPEMELETVYALAKKKDAIFDDPPTVAFQLEEGMALIKEKPEIVPSLLIAFDYQDFLAFFENLATWIYKRLSP
ncbi:MAG: nucleotidyl transferase AbiEii/AbiGii toxin family protein [Deltaproteobacteria bacterium]|nr:nucleotidyl transferase AbiEii/AbiGii toxin family protein [Deltaproteobacteria bacterium]